MNRVQRRIRRRASREACFNAYGTKCACCGETERAFLTFDHVAKDGAAHRKQIGTGGHLCEVLERDGFPPGFQVLCHNCNWARSALGACPHKDSSKAWSSQPAPEARPRRVRVSAAVAAEVCSQYLPHKVTMRQLSEQHGLSFATVRRLLEQNRK